MGVLDVGFVQMFEPIAARLVPVSAVVQGSQGRPTRVHTLGQMKYFAQKSPCSSSHPYSGCPAEHGRNLDISKTALLLAVLALLLAVQLTLDVVRMALSVTGVNAGRQTPTLQALRSLRAQHVSHWASVMHALRTGLFQPPSSILGVLSSAAVLLLAQGVARRGVLLSSWLWLSPERMRRASGSLAREVDPDIPTNGVR